MSNAGRAGIFIVAAMVLAASHSGAPVGASQANPFSKQARLIPRSSEPITIASISGSLEAFQRVAKQAGIRVVFNGQYKAPLLPDGFAIRDASVFDALDRLCAQTEAFWEVYDSKTVLVAPETAALRKSVDPKMILGGDNALLTDFAGNVFTKESDTLQKTVAPSHTGLQAMSSTISTSNQDSRPAFEAVAQNAGIRVVFHRQFASVRATVPFVVEDTDIVSALDLLAFQTGNFWQVHDPRTIIVATDNPTVRREVESMVIKAIPLVANDSSQHMTEVVTALRTLVALSQIVVSTPTHTIVLRDTAEKIALAERIVALMDKAGPRRPTPTESANIFSGKFAQPADVDARQAWLRLQLASRAPISIQIKQQSRQAFETLATLAGVRVLFHRQFANQAAFEFAVDNMDLPAALDLLCFQTGNFWQVYDSQTIIVATENPTVRRDVEPMTIKALYLGPAPLQEITELVTALRTILSFNQIAINSEAGVILLRDTADKVALAEKIAAIMRGAPVATSASISSGVFANPFDIDGQNARRAKLDVRSRAPFSIRINQQSRPAFETLCATANVTCDFERRFANQAAFAFAVDNMDIFSALDALSFQTGNFWRVQDSRTILIATDNPTVRREVDPPVTRTIYLDYIRSREGITEVITALRTVISASKLEPNLPNGITITETIEKVEIAERIVKIFDVPVRK